MGKGRKIGGNRLRPAYLRPGKGQYKGKRGKFSQKDDQQFAQQLAEIGARVNVMASDGNCMFRAVADQYSGQPESYAEYRRRAMDFMEGHRADFEGFLEDDEKWEDYTSRMRVDREWGGQQELTALSRLLAVNIVLHQLNSPRWEILSENASRTLHLSYHGEAHYNSVRAVEDPCVVGQPAEFLQLQVSAVAPERRSKQPPHHTNEAAEVLLSNAQEGEMMNKQPDSLEAKNEKQRKSTSTKKVGGQCPCGSGKKWRKCCRRQEKAAARAPQTAHRTGNTSDGVADRLSTIVL